MKMIHVVNKYKHDPTDHDFYIGRGSPLGNPFSHRKKSKANYKTETREEAIFKYKTWLYRQLETENEEVLYSIYDIISHYEKYARVNLVCFCKPKSCHGDVVKEVILSIIYG